MRILVVGDPHGSQKIKKIPVKGIDLVLITGDVGKADFARKFYFENLKRKIKGLDELEADNKIVKTIHMEIHNSTISILNKLSKFAPVYTIEGNVEIPTIKQVRENKKKYGIKLPYTRKIINNMKNVFLIKNVLRKINGLRIGFLEYFLDTNWVKDFKPSEYNKELSQARKETAKAKRILNNFKKVDILICHQPPYGYLDKVSSRHNPPKSWIGKHAGSKVILDYIKKYKPKIVLCGHIHEGEGKAKIGKTEIYNLGVAGYKIINL